MARIIIRTHARGPLGFVRLAAEDADAGVTYAAVRSAIAEQLFEVMPEEAYVFLLEDGVPVAPSQEATERVAKGMTDCFLAFSSEPRAPAAGITSPQSLAAGADGANAGGAPDLSPFSRPPRDRPSPPVTARHRPSPPPSFQRTTLQPAFSAPRRSPMAILLLIGTPVGQHGPPRLRP